MFKFHQKSLCVLRQKLALLDQSLKKLLWHLQTPNKLKELKGLENRKLLEIQVAEVKKLTKLEVQAQHQIRSHR